MKEYRQIIKSLQNFEGKKIYVGVSGGVDSAVSAALLKDMGAEVTGVYMKNWGGEAGLQMDCPWKEEQESAMRVCDHLGIKFFSMNFEKEYKKKVLDYFFSEYKAGRTPNPDILCNSKIKFKAFLERAISEGADYIATGHYAGIGIKKYGIDNNISEPKYFLLRGKDRNKDQSYFLSDLNQEQLSRSIFPLYEITKPQVRKLAEDYGLPNAKRKDSQGICFVGDLDVQDFLRKYIDKKHGDIIDIDTKKIVGRHDGISFYTLGQREGLGVGGAAKPYYVAEKNKQTNEIYVAMGRKNKHLWEKKVYFQDLHLISHKIEDLSKIDNLTASIRYRHKPEKGKIFMLTEFRGYFHFKNSQWTPSPGQSIVFYDNEICLGRGVIKSYNGEKTK